MNIWQVLNKKSRLYYVALVLIGIINSLLLSSILLIINNTVAGIPVPFFPDHPWELFCVTIVLALICNRLFQERMIHLSHEMLYEFEFRVLQHLKNSEYDGFLKIGVNNVYTAIQDTRILSDVPNVLMNLLNALTITVFCCIYLVVLQPMAALTIFSLMTVLLVVYVKRNVKIEIALNKLRDLESSYHLYLHDLLLGFKEIRMSLTRNNTLFAKYIIPNREKARDLSIGTGVKYLNNELLGSYSWYLLLGVILFALPGLFGFSRLELLPIVITLLYMTAPLATLINTFSYYSSFKIALERLRGFEKLTSDQVIPSGTGIGTHHTQTDFYSIEFKDVVYTYGSKELPFVLGPINIKIEKGEILFITGANGSGKSTFINVLTGLCFPTSGAIYYNWSLLTRDDYPRYRNNLSVIFSDNYLIRENYDNFDFAVARTTLSDYIRMMQLQDVIQSRNDERLDDKLSRGQQKRLAMIYALLENKDILILDEWAAEQDPSFRKYFYNVLIRDFKSKGKTVIVITHDDAFFSCADRIINFSHGQIVTDTRIAETVVN